MTNLPDKRTRIISAAIEIFGTAGFEAASMAAIAARASIAKGTLYLYFASKEQLFEDVYQLCCAERFSACALNTEALPSVLDQLSLRLRNGTRWEMAAPLKNRLIRAYLTHPLFSRNVAHVVEGLNTDTLEGLLQLGLNQGELRPLPVELLAEIYIRFGSAVYYYIERRPEELDNEALWQQIDRSLRGCMGAESHG